MKENQQSHARLTRRANRTLRSKANPSCEVGPRCPRSRVWTRGRIQTRRSRNACGGDPQGASGRSARCARSKKAHVLETQRERPASVDIKFKVLGNYSRRGKSTAGMQKVRLCLYGLSRWRGGRSTRHVPARGSHRERRRRRPNSAPWNSRASRGRLSLSCRQREATNFGRRQGEP